MLPSASKTLTLLALAASASAHLAAWHEAMWCLNGPQNEQDLNSYAIVSPLYQLSFKDWWFHAVNGCDRFPPAAGKFINLPAGGSFNVEIASNRAKTSLSYNGRDTSEWPDGETYPEDYNVPECITSPNMHAQNHGKSAGTAFAISYTSDLSKVTPENLVVFTVKYHTPWKRVTTYDVPADMPACPEGGCICAWGWVPNGCGQPNMYHQAFRCKVTGSRSSVPVKTPAKPPVWCETDESKCVSGAKQMVYWNQLEGNNVFVDGRNRAGELKAPSYNMVLGFRDGAQNDIFGGSASSPAPAASSSQTAARVTTQGLAPSASSSAAGAGATGGSGSGGSSSSGGSTTTSPTTTDSNTDSGTGSTETADAPKVFTTKAVRKCRKRSGSERRGVVEGLIDVDYVKREEVRREEVKREEVKREEVKREEVKRGVHAHAHRRGTTF